MSRSRRQLRALLAVLAVATLALPVASRAGTRGAARRAPSALDDAAFRERARSGLDHLYAMEFPAAEAEFAAVEARLPGHPAGPFLRALIPWWRLQIDPENRTLDGELLARMDEVLARARARLRRDRDDLDGLFFEAGASAFKARIATLRRQWFRAGIDGRRALKDMRRLAALDPGNDDLAFGLGLFDYLVEAVPARYRSLKPVAALFPRGDRQRGLAELRRAADKGSFVAAEARFALYQIFDQFEADSGRAAAEISQLRLRYPTNSVYHVAEGRLYARVGRLAEAGAILQEVAERQVEGAPGYSGAVAEEALYWLARVAMSYRRYDDALGYLDRLEYLAAERTYDAYFQAVGRLRRGMALDALGRRDEALRCYRDVLAMPEGGDARERAREFLARPFAG